jgi:beta-mannanase
MPLISWEPWRFGGGVNQRRYALKTILKGEHDAYIRQWAQAAAAWGKPFFLRFAHEMNGDWTSWSPGVIDNTSRDFVSAWRRVHSIFQGRGATNVRWVWAPVAHYEGATPYEDVYPGDEYVDWVGMSGYNWGNSQSWSRWQSFLEIFNQSYDKLEALTPKPIMIPEVASTESGGDKAEWIRRAFFEHIPTRFPKIRAVVWFHAEKEQDWRVNSSRSSLQAYRKVVASAQYQRLLLGG